MSDVVELLARAIAAVDYGRRSLTDAGWDVIRTSASGARYFDLARAAIAALPMREDPPLTCPAIDAFIRDRDPSDDVVQDLENIRHANSQLRYSMWGWKERSAELQAELDSLTGSRSAALPREAGADVPALSAGEPDPLETLVAGFAKALLAKLKLSRANGRSGWDAPDWEDECRAGLIKHIDKGDPRDVAAYCAFMWHHDWSTWSPARSATPALPQGEPVARAAAIEECAAYIDEVASYYPADGGSKSLLVTMAKEVRSLVTVPAKPTAPPVLELSVTGALTFDAIAQIEDGLDVSRWIKLWESDGRKIDTTIAVAFYHQALQDVRAVLNAAPSVSEPGVREQVARIINPRDWRLFDRWIENKGKGLDSFYGLLWSRVTPDRKPLDVFSDEHSDFARSLKKADAILAALTSAPSGWRTIDSAPKDGTHILLYQPSCGQFEGWWHDAWPRACEEYWMDYADSEPEPTHWQPLPSAPSDRRGGR